MPALADALCSQPWAFLGTDEKYLNRMVGASSSKIVMVERATSLMVAQIERLLYRRQQCLVQHQAFRCDDHQFFESVLMDSRIKASLRNYVMKIADNYHDVHYHSFQHASHVMLAANKLMIHVSESHSVRSTPYIGSFSSTVTASSVENTEFTSPHGESSEEVDEDIDNLCGPMAHFTVIFAAMIHDVDHFGVPNTVLVNEQHPYAVKYNNVSVAERNSFDFAFRLLDEAEFDPLRKYIFEGEDEYLRFKNTVHEIVLSTDIASSERQDLCKQRFNEVFASQMGVCKSTKDSSTEKRRRTRDSVVGIPSLVRLIKLRIRRGERSHDHSTDHNSKTKHWLCKKDVSSSQKVKQNELRRLSLMEHILLAADVSHCMQTWEVFLKWNAKLYNELNFAFQQGRSFDPSTNWYNGQVGFFDGYIIPLSQRLEKCGSFGAFGPTFVNLAKENKRKWLIEGEAFSKGLNCNKSNEDGVSFTTTKTSGVCMMSR